MKNHDNKVQMQQKEQGFTLDSISLGMSFVAEKIPRNIMVSKKLTHLHNDNEIENYVSDGTSKAPINVGSLLTIPDCQD